MSVAIDFDAAKRATALMEAFPDVDCGVMPAGHRVIVQIRTPKSRSKGGIILSAETKETEKWNTQVARVVSVGPAAFRDRKTLEPWPEGAWCKPGDFVRVPKYGGDRWAVDVPGNAKEEPALFCVFNDHEIVGIVAGDPLEMKAFI